MSENLSESPYPDAEDWQNAFEVYAGNSAQAFSLARQLYAVRERLQGERKNISAAMTAIDEAVDTLFEHTEFRSVSHELFRAVVEGRITTDQENLLHELGIRT